MRNRSLIVVFISCFSLWLSSCKKEFNFDKWEPDILAPLIKSKITAREVCDLKDKRFTQKIDADDDLGFPVGQVIPSIPSFTIPVIGPFITQLSDYFSFVDVDSSLLEISLLNNFPITISEGTEIVFRSSTGTSDESNVILRHILTRDVSAGELYFFSGLIRSKRVNSDVYLYLENLKSPGGADVIFSGQPTELTFEFKFLKIFTVGVLTNREHQEEFTTEVQFFEDLSGYEDNTAVGMLRVFLTNAMPVNYNFQMYFTNAAGDVVIDSLYAAIGSSTDIDMYIPGGTTSAPTGNPIDSITTKFEFPLSAARIRKLKDAEQILFRLRGNTNGYPGTEVYVGANSNLNLLITGDLKIKIANIF